MEAHERTPRSDLAGISQRAGLLPEICIWIKQSEILFFFFDPISESCFKKIHKNSLSHLCPDASFLSAAFSEVNVLSRVPLYVESGHPAEAVLGHPALHVPSPGGRRHRAVSLPSRRSAS